MEQPRGGAELPGVERVQSCTRPGGEVALLIDWENLKWSLRQNYNLAPNISSLLAGAREFGRLITGRAYADWGQPKLCVDASNLYRAGIEPIYVPGRHPVDGTPLKNSADVRLAVDAVDLCGRLPQVGTFVLVTGDGDLIHALNFLRLNGRRVVVVGVSGSMSALLSAAADVVLLYGRDVEPVTEQLLPGRPPATGVLLRGDVRPAPTGTSISASSTPLPTPELVYGWITLTLRERGEGQPVPFNALGSILKDRFAFDAQSWALVKAQGFPAEGWRRAKFKEVMLDAQAAGHIRVTTAGGLDYATLTDVPAPCGEPAAGGLGGPVPSVTASGAAAEIGLDALEEAEQAALLGFLTEFQDSAEPTFNNIVANLVYNSVLPRLSSEQVTAVVKALETSGILLRNEALLPGIDGEQPLSFVTYTLAEGHERMRCILQPPIPSQPSQDLSAERSEFRELLSALAVARTASGYGYFPAVQGVLEAQLGRRLRELGYLRPMAFFREAEARGLVRIARAPNGADILVPPDEVPSAEELATGQSPILTKLGEIWTPTVLRIIGTCEDLVGDLVQPASLLLQVRATLAGRGGPHLSSGEATRLLRRELVQTGYVQAQAVSLLHRVTGAPTLVETYALVRELPLVAAALAHGPIPLTPGIEVRTLVPQRLVSPSPPPL